MLSVKNLDVRYGGIRALQGVSIEIKRGETVLLLGANGAGKSSLLKSVIGTVTPVSGQIDYAGKSVVSLRADQRARLGIGYSPEGRRVFATMSVYDNVLSGAPGISEAARKDAYKRLSGLFPLLSERAAQPAGQLSGGQQQMVAFARAMCSSPELLLLDEPFLGLAPIWIKQISDAIREMKKSGTTILMSEQMAVPALKVADRGYVLRGGEIRHSGSAAEIRELALDEEYL